MLKLKKEKILVSLIAIVMIALVVGNIYSLAAEGNNTGIQLTQNTASSNNANTNKANTTANTDADVGAEVGATNSNSSKKNSTNTNKASNNTVKNTNTNSAKSKLPYAGSNSSIIFIVIALGVSAAYAYKKVSDYNV